MNKIGLKNSMMKIKDETDLLFHITHNKYQSLLNKIMNNTYNHYLNKKIIIFLKSRDMLLIKCMWELEGRISYILNIEAQDIDFQNKLIILKVKKRNGFINKILQK